MKKFLPILFCLILQPAVADDWEDWSEYAEDYDTEVYYEEPMPEESSKPATQATNTGRDTYVGIRLYKNEDIKYDFKPFEDSNSSFKDDNVSFGLTFGNRLTNHVKIELESEYSGADFTKYLLNYNYNVWANMLNIYLFQEYGGAVAPYFGVGIGASAIWADVFGNKDFQMDMSWQAMIGVNFALNNRIDLNIGFKYQDYGTIQHKNKIGEFAETKISATQLYLGLAYKFGL